MQKAPGFHRRPFFTQLGCFFDIKFEAKLGDYVITEHELLKAHVNTLLRNVISRKMFLSLNRGGETMPDDSEVSLRTKGIFGIREAVAPKSRFWQSVRSGAA